ncbi:MAG: glycoside hydrolase family 3 N-terminal domain-containing protein [Terriglobia bacterium]
MKARSEERLGQLFLVRFGDGRVDAARVRRLRGAAPGGILLPAPLPQSAELTAELLRKVAGAIPHPAFLAVREEGGSADALEAFLPPLPSPRAVAGKGLPAVARLGELIGAALSLVGFNTNFAPLLDLATSFNEKKAGARTFGADPRSVTECGNAFLRGQRKGKILAVGKHFPGQGSVPIGNPRTLAVSGKPMADLWREDLLPFRQLSPQLDMMLISPAAYKAYDFDHPRPACLSPLIVEGLLRVKLGYRGLVLAYELESEAVRGGLNVGETAVRAINAGCDMLIVDEGKPFEEALGAIEAALASGNLSPQRVEASLTRINTVKSRIPPAPIRVSKKEFQQLVRRFESFNSEFR